MKKILIIEDENALRKALATKLGQESYEILEAKNGLEGFELIKKEKPDLTLLDIIMPKLDGITLLQKVKMEMPHFMTPVIILTNLSDRAELEKALNEGVRDYLIKSDWKIEDVVQKVKEKLE